MDFQLFQVPWPWQSLTLPQMTRNVEDSLKHVHHTQREAGLAPWDFSLGDCGPCAFIPEALPGHCDGCCLGIWSYLWWGCCFDLYSRTIRSSPWLVKLERSLVWLALSSIFRQAETLAVHIWKVNSEGTIPDGTIVSAGSAAVFSSLYPWSLTLEPANSEAIT